MFSEDATWICRKMDNDLRLEAPYEFPCVGFISQITVTTIDTSDLVSKISKNWPESRPQKSSASGHHNLHDSIPRSSRSA